MPDSSQKIKKEPPLPPSLPSLFSPIPSWQDSAAPDGPVQKKTKTKHDHRDEYKRVNDVLIMKRRRGGRLTLHSNSSLAGSCAMRVGGHGTVLSGITHNTSTRAAKRHATVLFGEIWL